MKNCKAILSLLLLASPVNALTIDAVSVHPPHFSVTLSAVPDLVTQDEYGRPKDQFGFWITHATHVDPLSVPEMILRSGDALGAMVAWDAQTGDSLALMPYVLSGSTVTFDVPPSLLSGEFAWHLMVLRYGLDTDHRRGVVGVPIGDPLATAAGVTSWGRVKALYAR